MEVFYHIFLQFAILLYVDFFLFYYILQICKKLKKSGYIFIGRFAKANVRIAIFTKKFLATSTRMKLSIHISKTLIFIVIFSLPNTRFAPFFSEAELRP